VRQTMEGRLGQSLEGVRIHTGPDASAAAQSIGASAYAAGRHIVFGTRAYSPGLEQGQRCLAHELTHVLQQQSGAVRGTPTGHGLDISSPTDRSEAEATAVERLSHPLVRSRPESPAGRRRPVLQRTVGGDITQLVVTPVWVRGLTDVELDEQIGIVRNQLFTRVFVMPHGQDSAEGNLGGLQAERQRRQKASETQPGQEVPGGTPVPVDAGSDQGWALTRAGAAQLLRRSYAAASPGLSAGPVEVIANQAALWARYDEVSNAAGVICPGTTRVGQRPPTPRPSSAAPGHSRPRSPDCA
jgi:hypothetical protein